jgi:3,4-dihydroxy 2-butanone 4-phosphate synthase / GTP cyclohydrolase II
VSERPTMAGALLYRGSRELETDHGTFTVHLAQNLATRRHALALTHGEVRSPEPILARVHSSCVTSESYGACDCDCVTQLGAALATIAERGRGVVFYLMQEGRGAGFAVKARDRMMVQASRHRLDTFEAYRRMGFRADQRSYGEVVELVQLLGVRAPLQVLTSNPDKVAALDDLVRIEGITPLAGDASPYNRHYLEAKIRSGHRLVDPGSAEALAELPESVEVFEPYALPERPRFVHLATYLLPVADAGGPHWFRLFAYFDLETAEERVVLAYGSADAKAPLVRVQRERLLERLPLREGRRERERFSAAVAQIVAAGAGLIGLVPARGFDRDLEEHPADPAPMAELLAHHLDGRSARVLTAAEESGAEHTAALTRAGIAIQARVDLVSERERAAAG